MNLTVHALLQRDESLCFGDTLDVLDAVVEQLHEMLVILCVNLDEH